MIYLVSANDAPEAYKALRYAARMAESRGGNVGIIAVMDLEEFNDWGMVEARLRQELREKVEKRVWEKARIVNDINGLRPAIFIEEGDMKKALTDTVNNPANEIAMLILGGGTSGSNPGPLVAHFATRGLNSLRVPVMIVPGHLDDDVIDHII